MTDQALAILDDRVTLPASYLAARIALAKCDRIDECQEWASKAAAIASYAHQSKDDTLLATAERIRARAVRRLGELLGKVPVYPASGTSRREAADDAGLTRLDRLQASAVAAIPAAKFDEIVERKNPPKLYKLAAVGVKHKGGRPKGATRLSMLRRQLADAEKSAHVHAMRLAGALELVSKAKAALAAYKAAA
jgi:hypothetical protein